MVDPAVPERVDLRGVELVIGGVVDPSVSQVELLVVLVVAVAVTVGAYQTAGLGVTDVVEVTPVALETLLADVVDRARKRHGAACAAVGAAMVDEKVLV